MNKSNFLSSVGPIAMSPVERRMGRLMRGPDGHEAGGGENNTGGNQESGSESGSNQDNPSEGFDASAFWNEPPADKASSPPGVSAENGESAGGTDGSKANTVGQQLAERLNGFRIEPVFNDSIAEQLADGNMEGVNQSLQGMMQAGLKESIIMNSQLMREFGNNLMAEVRELVGSRESQKESTETLTKEFPSYSNPAMRRTIDGVFEQSMKHTNGDRAKAVSMTREMLKAMGSSGAQDMGLDTPPNGRGNESMSSASTSLIDSLLERNG